MLGVDLGETELLDGSSFAAVLADPDAEVERTLLYADMYSPNGAPPVWPHPPEFAPPLVLLAPGVSEKRMVRSADYKLIHRLGHTHQMFDLRDAVFEGEPMDLTALDPEQRESFIHLKEAMYDQLAWLEGGE
jgi:hypothetical protein